MNYTLELVIVPVSDVDRAKAFYTEQAGFDLHVDHRAGDDFRVVQLNPPGSACSIIGAHSLEDRREPICDESLALFPGLPDVEDAEDARL